MPTINRSTKPSGGSNWQNGDTVAGQGTGSQDLNADINTAINAINGNLDTDNLSPTAGIVNGQLAANTLTNSRMSPTAGIAPTKLDDASGTNGAHNTVQDPGDSDSNTLPTDVEDELQQLRHQIKRVALGDAAAITDGSTSGLAADGKAAWFDGAVIGPSVIRNGSFLDSEAESTGPTAPAGWSVIDGGGGGPSTLAPVALDVSEGAGEAIHMVDSGDVGRDGISQTLAGLKASSRYLIVARIKPITTTWQLTTTGATGTFGNLDLTTASGGSSWETLAGVIETDATPTDIVVNLIAGASASECHVSSCHVYPIGDDKTNREADLFRYRESTSETISTVESDLVTPIVVPGDGYAIEVDASIYHLGAGGGGFQLFESKDGAAAVEVDSDHYRFQADNQTEKMFCSHVNTSPDPGSVYTYTINIDAGLNLDTDGGTTQGSNGTVSKHRMRVRMNRII